MNDVTTGPISPDEHASPEQLREMLAMVDDERRRSTARYAGAVKELVWARRELARRNAEDSARDHHGALPTDPASEPTDPWQFRTAAHRAEQRREQQLGGSAAAALLGWLFLRLARRAARLQDYAHAEVFYQAVLFYRPRPFIWRQLGNMLAGQGLYRGAIDCFDRALVDAPEDAETWRVKSVALQRTGRRSEAEAARAEARRIDPEIRIHQ